LFMIAASILLLATTAAPNLGSLRMDEDWMAGCDNFRTCQVVSLNEDMSGSVVVPLSDGNLSIFVERGRAANAAVVLRMRLNAANLEGKPVSELRVDGRKLEVVFSLKDDEVSFEPAVALKVIEAMRDGTQLSLIDPKGVQMATVSLKGLKGSLRYFDIKQDRRGSVSALVDAGPNAGPVPTATTPKPPAPVLAAIGSTKEPKRVSLPLLEKLRASDPCRSNNAITGNPPAIYERLDARNTLLILRSRCLGYNTQDQLFIVSDTGTAKRAPFGAHQPVGEDPFPLANVWWDKEERRLRTYRKSRGIGGCGEMAAYAWDRSGMFNIVHYKSMTECRGATEFITTFRRDVVE
jgi:hypothetical protein